MRVVPAMRVLVGLVGLAAIAGWPAWGQQEVDPAHFESPSVEPFQQAKKGADKQGKTVRYEAKFTLPYRVECLGKSLRPGKYLVEVSSDGKRGQVKLNQKGQAIGITGVVRREAHKEALDALVVELVGKTRRLAGIQVAELELMFDPKVGIESPLESKERRLERLLLTETVQKR